MDQKTTRTQSTTKKVNSFDMTQFLITMFFVLLTIKLTGAATISWVVTCIPLMVIGGLFTLSLILALMVAYAKKVKSRAK